MPTLINRQDLIEEVRLQPHCDVRRCRARIQGHANDLHLIERTAVRSGVSCIIRLDSPERQLPSSVQGHDPMRADEPFDDIQFLQAPPEVQPSGAANASTDQDFFLICIDFGIWQPRTEGWAEPDRRTFLPGL